MKWNHLPVAGGLYAQDPELMDAFELIFVAKNKFEEEEAKKKEAEHKRQSAKNKSPRAGRGRRR